MEVEEEVVGGGRDDGEARVEVEEEVGWWRKWTGDASVLPHRATPPPVRAREGWCLWDIIAEGSFGAQ